jgi:hypothetical protein
MGRGSGEDSADKAWLRPAREDAAKGHRRFVVVSTYAPSAVLINLDTLEIVHHDGRSAHGCRNGPYMCIARQAQPSGTGPEYAGRAGDAEPAIAGGLGRRPRSVCCQDHRACRESTDALIRCARPAATCSGRR